MQDTTTCSTPKPRAGIEGLDVYRVAVEFYRLLRQSTRGRRGHVIDQSYRAAESVILNIAEAYPANLREAVLGTPRKEDQTAVGFL